MIGKLPKSIDVNGKEIPINTDYRCVLIVLSAMEDKDLNQKDKAFIILDALIGIDNLDPNQYEEALKQCVIFIDGGRIYEDAPKKRKLMDWSQDEQMIFSAVNNVAGYETRNAQYIHWWTFLGYYNEIKDGLFSQVLLIRDKKARGKKLSKIEQEFYNQNKNLINLKQQLSEEEKAENDNWNALLPD